VVAEHGEADRTGMGATLQAPSYQSFDRRAAKFLAEDHNQRFSASRALLNSVSAASSKAGRFA